MQKANNKKVVITSGYFNPLHVGHINLIREAKNLGDFLVVVVNNDEQVRLKGSVPFMNQQERMEIIKALKYADEVILSIDKDSTQGKTLSFIAEKYPGDLYFAKGGDRHAGNLPESELKACEKYNIKVVNGVGGGKVQSSSWLIKNSAEFKAKQA